MNKEKKILKLLKGGTIVSCSVRFNRITVYNNKMYLIKCNVNSYKYGMIKDYRINCTSSTVNILNCYGHEVIAIDKNTKIKKLKGSFKDVYKI